MLCKQLRLLARYVLRYRQKYKSDTLTLMDTFRADYINYASRAVRNLTADFMKVEQARKICTWLGNFEKYIQLVLNCTN